MDDSRSEDRQLRVGVIGAAGVGKSTLINALISERLPILPQGGIGPLTASPISVRYARYPYLKLTCLGSARVREMLASCNAIVSGQQMCGANDRAMRQLAALLACDSQFGRVTDTQLLAFLAACVEDESTWQIPSAMRGRAERAREIISAADSGRRLQIDAGVNLPRLLDALAQHGAGFLAPLTAAIELGWDAPVLRNGLVLVDLPGLGVANDIHRLQAVVAPLRAILLVVDRSGITEASAQLLRRAMLINEPAQNWPGHGVRRPTLLVAATKLDQSAAEAFSTSAVKVTWDAACGELATRAAVMVRSQLGAALADTPGESTRENRCVWDTTEVFSVFPREYQRLHRADSEEPARFRNAAATGIPRLVKRLQGIAQQ